PTSFGNAARPLREELEGGEEVFGAAAAQARDDEEPAGEREERSEGREGHERGEERPGDRDHASRGGQEEDDDRGALDAPLLAGRREREPSALAGRFRGDPGLDDAQAQARPDRQLERAAGALPFEGGTPLLGRALDEGERFPDRPRDLDRPLAARLAAWLRVPAQAASARISSKNSSTAARNAGTSGSWLMFWRRCRPFGRPWVYQPVNLRSLWSAQVPPSRSATMRKWPRIRSRRSASDGSVMAPGPPPDMRTAIWRNSQGLRVAPRPTMTPSQPVASRMRSASSGSLTSPLPITGICSVSLSFARCVQSASPVNIWRAVRACIATAATPFASHIRP